MRVDETRGVRERERKGGGKKTEEVRTVDVKRARRSPGFRFFGIKKSTIREQKVNTRAFSIDNATFPRNWLIISILQARFELRLIFRVNKMR